MNIAPEGAGRYDRLHGDEDQTLDLNAYVDDALADVVDTIITCGQWPAPSMSREVHVRFLLQEFIVEKFDLGELADLAVAAVTQCSDDFYETKSKFDAKVRNLLFIHLHGGSIEREVAERLAEDDLDA